jgi:hypothetical protein
VEILGSLFAWLGPHRNLPQPPAFEGALLCDAQHSFSFSPFCSQRIARQLSYTKCGTAVPLQVIKMLVNAWLFRRHEVSPQPFLHATDAGRCRRNTTICRQTCRPRLLRPPDCSVFPKALGGRKWSRLACCPIFPRNILVHPCPTAVTAAKQDSHRIP